MNSYDHLLFDLDGTLTDSEEGILNSIRYALRHFDITEDDMNKLRLFIGPPLVKTLQYAYEFSEDQAQEAVVHYRTYFAEQGIYENKVYPGIPELLSDLKHAGKELLLATSKRTSFAEQVLEMFSLDEYFSIVVGGSPDGTISDKNDVIRHIFTITGNEIKNSSVMIGDRKYDILGAHEHGIDSIAVMYGYGTQSEIDEAGPTYRVNTVDELRSLLLDDCSTSD
jgi:phosphoglycolate phosphatase